MSPPRGDLCGFAHGMASAPTLGDHDLQTITLNVSVS